MTLTPDQKQAVTGWIAAGDNLSTVQKKLIEQFQITLTYRDVRFLVDDLNLELKDPAPKVDTTDVSKTAPAKPAAASANRASPENAPAADDSADSPAPDLESEVPAGDDLEDLPAGGAVSVEVDKVTLLPGALASGTVRFSDGVTGKWVVDQYGRPGFTEISQPGYRPSPADGQAFMQELSAQLQRRGF
ncbi:MAG TPA: hypothetical protein VHO24_20525 [Opitutaceae bacterium]|nr:hypothetical protein [Opitutaceae bacterium]